MPRAPTLSHLHVLSRDAGERLLATGLTVSLAESCTGGLVASVLTDIAGSSAYVLGGIVSYSNEAKMRLLGVPERVLAGFGAVSAETAAAMAAGARTRFGSDLALAVTGIAGPGGGTPSKPVGLVHLHLSSATSEEAVLHIWPYDRAGNKRASVAAALGMILRHLAVSTPSGPRPAGAGKPVVVEATQRSGRWKVRAVWLDDRRCEVVGQGRQTPRPDGSVELLVEAVGGVRLALIVDTERGVWWVRQVWPASGAGSIA